MPREVTATTTASTASSATPMTIVTSTRENHEAAYAFCRARCWRGERNT